MTSSGSLHPSRSWLHGAPNQGRPGAHSCMWLAEVDAPHGCCDGKWKNGGGGGGGAPRSGHLPPASSCCYGGDGDRWMIVEVGRKLPLPRRVQMQTQCMTHDDWAGGDDWCARCWSLQHDEHVAQHKAADCDCGGGGDCCDSHGAVFRAHDGWSESHAHSEHEVGAVGTCGGADLHGALVVVWDGYGGCCYAKSLRVVLQGWNELRQMRTARGGGGGDVDPRQHDCYLCVA
mmetsp:Transcript_20784/g.47791  ORF Transcript_20784/g.47791 Transcript_20784/m.47791 type:complete len:231 (+) Transcript_20784:1048-1740(+)